jgi:hypothetical protein
LLCKLLDLYTFSTSHETADTQLASYTARHVQYLQHSSGLNEIRSGNAGCMLNSFSHASGAPRDGDHMDTLEVVIGMILAARSSVLFWFNENQQSQVNDRLCAEECPGNWLISFPDENFKTGKHKHHLGPI